jgi:hypothetical protein
MYLVKCVGIARQNDLQQLIKDKIPAKLVFKKTLKTLLSF